MPRRRTSREQARVLAVQRARRKVAAGERPLYSVRLVDDEPPWIPFIIVEMPWVAGLAWDHAVVLASARELLAEFLDVPPSAFDIRLEPD